VAGFNKLYYLAIPVVLIILVILFYISPFSEVQYPQKCVGINTNSSANAGSSVICGNVITKKIPVSFPFKANPQADWCRSFIPKVEAACALNVDSAWLDDRPGYSLGCLYFLNKTSETWQGPASYILIIKNGSFDESQQSSNINILSWAFFSEVQCPGLIKTLSEQ
jgi:hypothetical protein